MLRLLVHRLDLVCLGLAARDRIDVVHQQRRQTVGFGLHGVEWVKHAAARGQERFHWCGRKLLLHFPFLLDLLGDVPLALLIVDRRIHDSLDRGKILFLFLAQIQAVCRNRGAVFRILPPCEEVEFPIEARECRLCLLELDRALRQVVVVTTDTFGSRFDERDTAVVDGVECPGPYFARFVRVLGTDFTVLRDMQALDSAGTKRSSYLYAAAIPEQHEAAL